MMHCSILFAVLRSRGTDILNDRPKKCRARGGRDLGGVRLQGGGFGVRAVVV